MEYKVKKKHFIYFILLILPTDRIYELHEACKLFMRIILKYRIIGFFALHPEIRFFQSIAKLCVPSVTWFCLHFASTLNQSNRDSYVNVLQYFADRIITYYVEQLKSSSEFSR